MNWHKQIEDAIDRNAVEAVLTRLGDSDVSVSITIAPVQYQETRDESAPGVGQQSRRWMIPARRLALTDFPLPIRIGDMLRVAAHDTLGRIIVVGRGVAGGEIIRWDITEEGIG